MMVSVNKPGVESINDLSERQFFVGTKSHHNKIHDSVLRENLPPGLRSQTVFSGRLASPLFAPQSVSFSDSGEEEILIPVSPGIMAKPEVEMENLVPELKDKLGLVFQVYQKHGYADYESTPLVITSANDCTCHVENSRHYANQAIDVRGKHVPDRTLKKIGSDLRKLFGPSYRVIVELYSRKHRQQDHIHIEYVGTEPVRA